MAESTVLVEAARDAARYSHSPFSRFAVGAAVLTADGQIFRGCNIESSSYGLTVCAERNAIASAVVNGHKDFKALAVFSEIGALPCGACRQVIWDICGDIPIYVADKNGKMREFQSSGLLPVPFDDRVLRGTKEL